MELRHLRYFVRVAEEENVSRAALKLHVSQPGISRQIRDLEDELGVKLFERTAKSLKLTEAGKVFLQEARAVLQGAEEAVKAARAAEAGTGELHVGYAPSLTARFLPQALRAFQAAAPGVRVRLHDASTAEMLAGLRERKLELALTVTLKAGISRGLKFEELTRDNLCVVVAPGHKWSARKTMTLAEVAGEPLIAYSREDYPDAHEMLMRVFAAAKVKPRIAEEYDSASSLIAAVEAGNGVAVVARSLDCSSGTRLRFVALTPEPPAVVVGAFWVGKLSGVAKKFLTCTKQITDATLSG